MFTDAAPNLAMNGMPLPPLAPYLSMDPSELASALQDDDTYEPFDERKRQRLVDLAAEEEDLLRDIAALKQRVPREVAARFAEAAKAALREDEEMLARKIGDEAALARVQILGGGGGGGNSNNAKGRRKNVAGVTGLPTLGVADETMDGREDEVRREFADAVVRLSRLKSDMAGVVARMERAKAAGDYVVSRT